MKLLFLLSLMLYSAPVEIAEQQTDQSDSAVVELTLEDAIKIALSENISVKVADKEIKRTEYAKYGTYASLFPQIDGNASYQRTIKKQVMYMDFATSASGGESDSSSSPAAAGIEVGRWNSFNAGISASMPIVNAQLWKSLQISAIDVELAVEKARASRLSMVSSVKDAYFAVLMAKASNDVYEKSYVNALANFAVTESRYKAEKASEMEYLRAKTTVANVQTELYNSRSNIGLALWQLKAVMGVDLEMDIDVKGSLKDYADTMFYDIHQHDDFDLGRNTSLIQLDKQISELAKNVQMNTLAYVPTISLAFSYSYSASANDFKFESYRWNPYSYAGLTLSIPICSGGRRFNAIRQSKVQLEQAKLQQQQVERELKVAIKSCLLTMENSMTSYYSAQTAVDVARKAYDVSALSYQVGKVTLVELNDAMLALAQAELMEWQTIYQFLSAKTTLEEQLGKDYTQN